MTHTIELRSLNSISVPNLVSIAKNFLEPEDPSRINFSGLVAGSLHPTRTATTKTYMLGKHACDLQVWHQRRVPSPVCVHNMQLTTCDLLIQLWAIGAAL